MVASEEPAAAFLRQSKMNDGHGKSGCVMMGRCRLGQW